MHAPATTVARQWRARAAVASVIGMLALSPVAAQTVNPGTVVQISSDGTFSSLLMNGGEFRFSNPATGQALQIVLQNAVLERGLLNNPYTQTGISQLFLTGTTQLPGGSVAAFPADGMYIGANRNDTPGLLVNNTGEVLQTGTGQFTTLGPVQFNNRNLFNIQNDLGFVAGDFAAQGIKAFFNTGLFKKTGGSATSVIDANFQQDGGTVEAHSGSLSFVKGGLHNNASFAADPTGGNPGGQILLSGAHSFDGTVITKSGGLIGLAAGGTLDVLAVWDQRGSFSNAGQIRISESGILGNSGFMLPTSGTISGTAGLFGGVVLNAAAGTFSHNIAPATDTFGTETGRLNVVNRGTFTVAPGQEVRVKDFVNESGTVTVNGMVENIGGTFQLLGGFLYGSGIVNGDGITVGGGPGVAVFNPGNSPGTMTINGPFSLLPGGVLELEVQRDPITSAITHDMVAAESFLLNGKLSFLIGAGVQLSDVAGLQFLDCGGACNIGYGSDFSYEFPGRPGSSVALEPNGLFITALAPVPEPETFALLLSGLGLIGWTLRRRRDSGPQRHG